MKHFILTCMCLLTLSLTSCIDSDEPELDITDYAPIGFYMHVNDASGTTLLDPEKNPQFFNDTYISYFGKEYPIVDCRNYTSEDWANHIAQSRYYLPTFYGFILVYRNEKPCLYFGEFDGAVATTNETFTIHWSDGSSDIVGYSNTFSGSGNSITTTRKYFLNDEAINSPEITFVK